MNQKTVFLAGFIGLLFGFLFSGTLGIDFFSEEEPNNIDDKQEAGELKKDEEDFRLAYDLTESIYVPITGDEAYDKQTDGDTFILYAGRDTCPYCQQFVPVLQEAAQNLEIDMIYHVDTIDDLNEEFVNNERVFTTPTTFIFKDGVLVDTIVGYMTLEDTEMLLTAGLN